MLQELGACAVGFFVGGLWLKVEASELIHLKFGVEGGWCQGKENSGFG